MTEVDKAVFFVVLTLSSFLLMAHYAPEENKETVAVFLEETRH
jgi:hypothetical protein